MGLADIASAELAERSLYEFVRQAWGVVVPGSEYVDNWHIGAICEHLQAVTEGQIKDLLVNVPPRHGKSTITAVCWPAWSWIRNPKVRFLFASYAETLSVRDSVACRALIQSAWFQERWGDRFRFARDSNQKTEFLNDHGGYRTATSVGGAATGKGGDIVCVDDPHSLGEVYSQAKLEGAVNWWRTTMTTRRNDPQKSARVVVGQRVHQKDVSAHCIGSGEYTHLCLPQRRAASPCKTGLGWKDPRREENELLWPQRITEKEDASQRRDLGTADSDAQLDQNPTYRGGNIIKVDWPRFYKTLPHDLGDLRLSFDCAFKGTDASDNVACQVWGRAGAAYYLIDSLVGKMDINGTLTAVRALSAKWPSAIRKLVEDKANGPAIMSLLAREIPGLVPWPAQGKRHPGKAERVHAVSPLFEAGNVWLPEPESSPWVASFLGELTGFPGAAHDDQVDACTQALLDYVDGTPFVFI